MKKFYLKPETRVVDINTKGSLLTNQPEISDQGNTNSVWSEEGERLPSATSVWGKDEEEE